MCRGYSGLFASWSHDARSQEFASPVSVGLVGVADNSSELLKCHIPSALSDSGRPIHDGSGGMVTRLGLGAAPLDV